MSLSSKSPPLAVFFGDAHLDAGAWANRPQIKGDSIAAFQYICNVAIKYQIPYVFGAGDLIDVKKPAPEIVQFVRAQLDKLQEANIQFKFIQGQHEYAADLPWFCAIHDWPDWINGKTVTIRSDYRPEREYYVHGMDWHTADAVGSAMDQIPEDCHILLAHQVWEEFMGDKCGCECSFAQVPYVDTVFTGDFHQNKRVKYRNAQGESMVVISPGSTNMRKIDEPVDKYFYILHEDYTWTRVLIPTRRKIEISIRTEEELETFEERFEAALAETLEFITKNLKAPSRPLVRIIYNDELEQVYTRIKSATDGKNLELFLKPLPASVPEEILIDRQNFNQAASQGLVGMLAVLVPTDSSSYKILSRLIDSVDPKLELQLMKKERGLI